MPIYEYQCEQCEHRFEKLQKMSAEPLRDCPACGQPALKKLVSAAAFKLTGSGWYETDFKNSKPAAAGEKSSGGTADAGGGSDSAAASNASSDSGASAGKSAEPKAAGSGKAESG